MNKTSTLLAAVAVLLVASACDMHDSTSARVHIRSNGHTVTTYNLDNTGRILQSETLDRYGQTVLRTYTYDTSNRLEAVHKSGPGSDSVTRFVQAPNKSNGNTLFLPPQKSISSQDGSVNLIDVRYYYKTDGSLDGILQTDSNGNIQAISSDD